MEHPFSLTHHGSIPLSTNSQLHPDGSDAVLNDGTTAAEAGEISRVSEEFVLFVQSITAHIMDEEGGEQGRPQQLLLLTLPQPAYGLLSIAQGWRPGPIGQRVAECTHLACLLYLAVTSLAFSASPQLTAHFSQWFGYVVRTGIPPLPQAGQDHLLFLLLKGPPDLEETESGLTAPEHHIYRVWLVSRLMSVAKKLKQASWTILTSRLLLFLRFPSDLLPQGAEEEARAELDMDELRREIYGDLYPYIRQ